MAQGPLDGRLHQVAEPLIAEQDRTVGVDRQRRLVHRLDDHAVDVLGAGDREDLFALRAGHDQRVDLAGANRLQRLFRLFQTLMQCLVLLRQLSLGARVFSGVHGSASMGVLGRRSRPDEYFLLVGHAADELGAAASAICLINVGAAMICSPSTSLGR